MSLLWLDLYFDTLDTHEEKTFSSPHSRVYNLSPSKSLVPSFMEILFMNTVNILCGLELIALIKFKCLSSLNLKLNLFVTGVQSYR